MATNKGKLTILKGNISSSTYRPTIAFPTHGFWIGTTTEVHLFWLAGVGSPACVSPAALHSPQVLLYWAAAPNVFKI